MSKYDFSDIRNVVAFCVTHKDALNAKQAGFVAQCEAAVAEKGEHVYFTHKQIRFLQCCKEICLRQYPLPEEEISGIARMKMRRDALNHRLRRLGIERCRRHGVAPVNTPSVAVPDIQSDAIEITVKATGWRAEKRRHAEYKGILRQQKPKR